MHQRDIRSTLALHIVFTMGCAAARGEETMEKPYGIDDLYALKRLSETQISPDGGSIVYQLKEPSLEKNSFASHLWIAPIPEAAGGPRQLTNHEKGESRPRWSPDGKSIAFISSRGGSPQIWTIPIDGGEARQISSLSTGADNHLWSPDGKLLAFSSDVWPDLKTDEEQKKRAEEIEKSGVKARTVDRLLYRHWTEWREGKRTHVFVVPAEGGAARDVTPGDFDCPPFSLGGPDSFSLSPDGKEIAFTRGPAKDLESWSTNADLFVAPVAGGEAVNLTSANKGWDGSPVWSPDGKLIAFRSQERDGYEADRFRLALLERSSGKIAYLAPDLDRSVDEILWAPDSKRIYFGCEEEGRAAIYSVALRGLEASGKVEKHLEGVHFTGLSLSRDGRLMTGEVQSIVRPAEAALFPLGATGGTGGGRGTEPVLRITGVNDEILRHRAMPTVESVHYPGADGAKIQAWVLKPPGHAAGKPSPFLYFIHGGPQGAWTDAFSFRWNAALYAAQGYTVMLPNPRGSTGFGQKFTEEISGDWPGRCYQDVMKGVDWAIAEKLADPKRMAALGGSFGGYMVNWILGHTDRFRCLVSHAGVYNLESMYGTTEELWFPEWELGGPPWKPAGALAEAYQKFSPHRFAANFRTPTLVIHGELDFRVAISEGLQLFTALKRQGVEAKMLYFPDEGHWVLKLKNSKLWNETVMAWLDSHLR